MAETEQFFNMFFTAMSRAVLLGAELGVAPLSRVTRLAEALDAGVPDEGVPEAGALEAGALECGALEGGVPEAAEPVAAELEPALMEGERRSMRRDTVERMEGDIGFGEGKLDSHESAEIYGRC